MRLCLLRPLARIAGEGAERSEAGEGVPAPGVRFAPLVERFQIVNMLYEGMILLAICGIE